MTERRSARADADPPRPHRRPASFVLLALVVAVQALAGLQRRWMQEDGFINVRIAQQVLAGHGPVFNVGERVEAFTSPLWLAVLVVLRVLTFGQVPYEWLAVGAGLVLSVVGTVGLLLGSVALWTPARARADRGWWVPVGILVPLALPPFWDFSTSGLETGLAWGWLGASFAAVATAVRQVRTARPADGAGPRLLTGRYVLIGLGPLVRPELALYAVGLGLGLLLLVERPLCERRAVALGWWRSLAAWLALPLAYQVFRMGYYAALVPNTALAKSAGSGVWGRGVTYLSTFAGTYRLAFPLVVLVAVTALRPTPRLDQVALGACVVVPALLHALYVVWVGGDYMHGRFWLIPVLGLVAPLAALPLPPRRATSAAAWRTYVVPVGAAVVALWALVAATSWRPPQVTADRAIDDQRALVVAFTGNQHPVRLADQPAPLREAGRAMAERRGGDVFVDIPDLLQVAPVEQPRALGTGVAGRYDAIGVTGVAAGIDVFLVDPFGLADPVSPRQPSVAEYRAGHTHYLAEPWRLARAGVVGPAVTDDVAAAQQAFGCGDLGRYLGAVRDPITPGRFLRNLWSAPANTVLEVPADPHEAVRRFCGPAGP